MTVPKVKYQIVVGEEGGTELVMTTYVSLDDAKKMYKLLKATIDSGQNSIVVNAPNYNRIELQRVEVLEV